MAFPPLISSAEEPALSSRQKILRGLLRLVLAAAITLVLTQLRFDYLESIFYDFRVHFKPQKMSSGNIEIIMVDAKTVAAFKSLPGFKEHTTILQKLAPESPRAVIYHRQFAPMKKEPTQKFGEDQRGYYSGTPDDERSFAAATKLFAEFYLQTDTLKQAAEAGKLTLVEPFEHIHVESGPRVIDRTVLARDGVSRRMLITYQGQPLLHSQVAALFNPEIKDLHRVRGLFDFLDSEQIYIDFLLPGSFPISKFEDVYNGKVDMSRFHNKLVLIGDDIGVSGRDYLATPFSHDATLTATELHANMFDTLVRNSATIQQPHWQDILLTLSFAMLTLFIVATLRPLEGLVILAGSALIFSFISCLVFWFCGIWVEMAHPLLAAFIGYYFFIPYRLIVENRRSWEYFQKHKLLQQVEELKTNFISMMSHDLKTPIARIQGMTEIISKGESPLSPPQREAVDTIRTSASDLLSFVSSILNYARLESEGVLLHLQACDINELLSEVIRRYDYLAKQKQMKITPQLEPLFSLSGDPELLRQVFSNLLENAIKYSPVDSEVTIRSVEDGGFVKIEFIDKGPGIPEDELSHLFMKFFRSRNVKNSPIKGSGLGLYLAKYFTELHKGQIFVTSSPGNGTIFTVQIPLKHA